LPSSEWTISERLFTIKEVKEKADAGKLVEAFGAGTAAIVSPIGNISWKGNEIKVPVGSEGTGELTKTVLDWIMGIQYGKEPFKNWSRVVQ
jgi:branched-chain amino acid aminotransferase